MAAGDTLLTFFPLDNRPPATDFATLDTRNSHDVLDFRPDTINERAVFRGVVPQHYSGGDIVVYIHYSMSTAVASDIDWDVEFERVGDQQQDIDSDGFAAPQSVDNTTVPGTSGLVDIVTITLTNAQADGLTVGDSFRIRVTRDGISDGASGDAELYATELREAA